MTGKERRRPREGKGTQFSVVVPTYNVENYLTDFFRSLTGQSLDFKTHIELVVVDDGSTDRSAKIVKRWQRRYPDNIRYTFQTRGGPGSARNAGLLLATHEWIAFVDPDDFIDRDYFARIDECLRRQGDDNLALLSANLIVFDEKTHSYLDQHPLRYRYSTERLVAASDPGRFIQLGVTGALVRGSLIRQWGLKFDERIRPNFEDAHFVGRYLLRARQWSMVFLPQAKYFYRHRADRTSLRDSTTRDAEWYGDKLEFGHLGLLNDALSLNGTVPRYVQNTVLYDLSWQFAHLMGQPKAITILTRKQRERFVDLLAQIFLKIDSVTIANYDIWDFPTAYRVGILNLFKSARLPVQIVEVTGYEPHARMARVAYWSPDPEPSAQFTIDGRLVEPSARDSRRIEFLGSEFCWEHTSWINIASGRSFTASIDGKLALADCQGRRNFGVMWLDDIRSAASASPGWSSPPAAKRPEPPRERSRARLLSGR
jgi:glycosyltransferase involved in cell wall biosynthesis